MSSMREKLARAMCDILHGRLTFGELPDSRKNAWLIAADAVLDALMEPSEGMIARGEALSDFILSDAFDNSVEGRRAEFRGAFIEAIRAAKEDGQ